MPTDWTTALTSVTGGMGEVLTIITGDALLLAITFGFLFVRKAIGAFKKLVKLSGKN